jgi:hypothetical protein
VNDVSLRDRAGPVQDQRRRRPVHGRQDRQHQVVLESQEPAGLARGLKIGVASSVRAQHWEAAEIYPRHNPAFPLTEEQRDLLALFSPQP